VSTKISGGHVHTISKLRDEVGAGRRRRRNHSAEFKALVVDACSRPGASVAAVAMANGVNANLARRWIVAAERRLGGGAALPTVRSAIAPTTFVPLGLPAAEPQPAPIRIELRRGATTIDVSWPGGAAAECAAWMRELLR
jgi:transposase